MKDDDFKLYKKLKFLKLYDNDIITNKIIDYVNLEKFYCNRRHSNAIFTKEYPSLRVLRQYDDGCNDEVLKNLPNLEKLSLNYSGNVTNNGLKILTKLKSLRLPYYSDREIQLSELSDEGIKNLINLKKLYCNFKITNKGLKKLQLTELHCRHNYNITDKGIEHMKLKYLNCGRAHLTDRAIQNACLEELHCGENTHFTDVGIMTQPLKSLFCYGNNNKFSEKIINKLQLRKLDCGMCDYLTDAYLESRTIHYLSCNYCYGFTNSGVSKLDLYEFSCPRNNTKLTSECLRGSKVLDYLGEADNISIDCLDYCQIKLCSFDKKCENMKNFRKRGVMCIC